MEVVYYSIARIKALSLEPFSCDQALYTVLRSTTPCSVLRIIDQIPQRQSSSVFSSGNMTIIIIPPSSAICSDPDETSYEARTADKS